MSLEEIVAKLRSQATVSVPDAGKILADLSRNGSYEAARQGKLGVPVIKVGGLSRVPSAAILRVLHLDEPAAA
jgi:hypothetical protein